MKKYILLLVISTITFGAHAQTPCNKLYEGICNANGKCNSLSQAYACIVNASSADDSTVTINNFSNLFVNPVTVILNCQNNTLRIPQQIQNGDTISGTGVLIPYHKIIINYTLADSSGQISCSDTLFTPNAPLAAKDLLHQNIQIFPNPANNKIEIQLDNVASEFTVELLNIEGKKLLSSKGHNAKSLSLNISTISKGLYFVRIQTPHGQLVKKLQKQ